MVLTPQFLDLFPCHYGSFLEIFGELSPKSVIQFRFIPSGMGEGSPLGLEKLLQYIWWNCPWWLSVSKYSSSRLTCRYVPVFCECPAENCCTMSNQIKHVDLPRTPILKDSNQQRRSKILNSAIPLWPFLKLELIFSTVIWINVYSFLSSPPRKGSWPLVSHAF